MGPLVAAVQRHSLTLINMDNAKPKTCVFCSLIVTDQNFGSSSNIQEVLVGPAFAERNCLILCNMPSEIR
jgi:hypothetical protein